MRVQIPAASDSENKSQKKDHELLPTVTENTIVASVAEKAIIISLKKNVIKVSFRV